VNTIEDFVAIVRDEVGLPVTTENVGAGLDELPGWDSVHLLSLMTVLEQYTGRRVSLPDALGATSLAGIYELVRG
jgi:acyl carrier protein